MRVAAFGDLWVGDYHHGPLVMAPGGKPTTAKLAAFIDHCTRYPVADRYYLNEELVTVRDTMLRAFLRFGPPRRAYVDRGAVYKAEQLAYSLDRVGSKLIHSRAYYSQGRGLIEKWWQVADQFEAEIRVRDELVTIHELDQLWGAWRELRYLQRDPQRARPHPPAQAIAEVVPRPLDPAGARELGVLAALDATLATAAYQLLAANPELGLDALARGDLPPSAARKASAVVFRINDLREMIRAYHHVALAGDAAPGRHPLLAAAEGPRPAAALPPRPGCRPCPATAADRAQTTASVRAAASGPADALEENSL
jgi:transposase InsO family protein